MSTTNSIPTEVKSLLATHFAQGKSNQQSFTIIRNKGFSITYSQVAQYRSAMDSTFNSAFNAVFCQ